MFYWPLLSERLLARTVSRAPSTHELPDRPWNKVETDLFTYNGDNYTVIVDYYSNFIELDCLRNTTSQAVILKTTFVRHGTPDFVVSDNGSQYISDEFQPYSYQWEFQHVTSSLRYPQSNGKVESAEVR